MLCDLHPPDHAVSVIPRWAVRVGDVEVRVRDVYFTPVVHDAAGARRPGEHQRLVITIRATNLTTRPIRYRDWSTGYGDHDWPSVVDDAGTQYPRTTNPSDVKSAARWTHFEGSTSGRSELHPRGWHYNCFVFDRPVDKANYVRLALPADHLPGGAGLIQFQIRDLDTRRISHLMAMDPPPPGESDAVWDGREGRPFKLNLLRDPLAAPSPTPP